MPAFVKLGADDGHIEIELKGKKGGPNLVINRTLSAHSKSSQFTINGKAATGKEINARMQELNVQVTNLWYDSPYYDGPVFSLSISHSTFLPQDKVASFASMTRFQLLQETQRAAGNPNLSSWHETLMEAGKEMKGMVEVHKTYSAKTFVNNYLYFPGHGIGPEANGRR